MTEPRRMEGAPRWARPWGGKTEAAPAAARPRRPRIVDEERRLLREAEAGFAGAHNKRPDADTRGHVPWDEEPDGNTSHPSRLFRE